MAIKRQTIIDNLHEWIKELEIGKHKQGKNRLRTDANGGTEYCCLGVACEKVLGREFVTEYVEDRTDTYRIDASAMPIEADNALLGLNEAQAASLAMLNDTHNVSFEAIAEIVRAFVLEPLHDEQSARRERA